MFGVQHKYFFSLRILNVLIGVAYAVSGMSFDVEIMVCLGTFKTNLSKRSFTTYDL